MRSALRAGRQCMEVNGHFQFLGKAVAVFNEGMQRRSIFSGTCKNLFKFKLLKLKRNIRLLTDVLLKDFLRNECFGVSGKINSILLCLYRIHVWLAYESSLLTFTKNRWQTKFLTIWKPWPSWYLFLQGFRYFSGENKLPNLLNDRVEYVVHHFDSEQVFSHRLHD